MSKYSYYAIPGLPRPEKINITPDLLLIKTSQFFNIGLNFLAGKSRLAEYVKARQFYFYFGRHIEGFTLTSIAKSVNRDHTTVIHGISTLQDMFDTDPLYRKQWAQFIEFINDRPEAVYSNKNHAA